MEEQRKQKRNLVIIGTVVGVIVIGLIIYLSVLWKNGVFSGGYSQKSTKETSNLKISASDIAKYTEASTENVESRVTEKYVTDIKDMFLSRDTQKIYNLMADDFCEENNLSEKNVEEYLESNGFFGEPIWLDMITFYEEENIYVYRIKFIIDYKVKYINVIEEAPYRYTLDFRQETVPSINTRNYNITVDGINFEVKEYKKTEKSITFNVKITNTTDKNVKFNFINVSNVGLKIEGGDVIKQPTAILETDTDYSINKDSYFIKSFYFPINMQYHKDIVGLNFYNVKIGNEEMNIYLNF